MKTLKNPWPASVWQLKWSGNSSMSPRNLPFGEDYFYYHCMVYGDILDGSLLLLGSLYVNMWFIDTTINIWLIYVWWYINSIMVHYRMYYMNITYINLSGSLLYGDTTVSMAFRRIWVVSSFFFLSPRPQGASQACEASKTRQASCWSQRSQHPPVFTFTVCEILRTGKLSSLSSVNQRTKCAMFNSYVKLPDVWRHFWVIFGWLQGF